MNIIKAMLACIFLISFGFAQELTLAEKMELDELESQYPGDLRSSALDYAFLSYRIDEHANHLKADTALNHFIALQDNDPESVTYGQWDWRWKNNQKVVDFNRALFMADMMFGKLWEQQDKMSVATRKNFITSCERLLEAAVRRWDTEVFDIGRDFVNYSNIFVLYIETFTRAGARFHDARLQKTAVGQWTRWYNHISYYGIDEFASPTYNRVIFKHLANIHDFSNNERVKREVKEVMDHIYLLQSVLTHPNLKVPVTGISRDYRKFIERSDARSGVLTRPLPKGYSPPAKAVNLNKHRSYPFEVIGKAATNPFIFISYQLKDAGMGSFTGGNCYEQQIHCFVAVGKNEHERASAFLQGTYVHVNGFTDQIKNATLCVYNRLPNYWHTTQWRGDMSKYQETFDDFGIGITSEWKEKLNTPDQLVFSAYDYELHIFPFRIQDEKLVSNQLTRKHRTSTSPSGRYHPRERVYDEFVFPEDDDWFGAFITFVKSGAKVKKPEIIYAHENGIRSFNTDLGHQIRLFVTENNETKQLFNVDPEMIPLLKFTE
ncbi:MAG: hypothetical protein DWQ10_04685 [Calditrichaeota bacterium]|nr:MAG: hypothetical protein DWQ10_04685 [Calditrichota bacterium]